MDKQGKPLRNHILHSDTRAIKEWEELKKILGENQIYKITGNRIDPRSSIPKIMWIRKNEEEIYKKTYKFLQAKDYITYKLTGTLGITDYSDASHSVLFDINKRRWSEILLEASKIDKEKLPEIHSSADIIGYLGKQQAEELGLLSGIPVVAGGGDGACASAGTGVVKKGESYTYLGSTAWITTILDEPFIDSQMRVFNIISLDSNKCGVYGTIQTAGTSYQWLRKLLGRNSYEELNKLAEKLLRAVKDFFSSHI